MKTLLSLVLVLVMAGAVCAQPPKDGPGQKPQIKQEKPERPMMGPPPWARHGMMGGPERSFQGKGRGPAVYHGSGWQGHGRYQQGRGSSVDHRGSGPRWQGHGRYQQGRGHHGYRKHSEGLTIIIRIG